MFCMGRLVTPAVLAYAEVTMRKTSARSHTFVNIHKRPWHVKAAIGQETEISFAELFVRNTPQEGEGGRVSS